MQKLKLILEELQVESFGTADHENPGRGTVHGYLSADCTQTPKPRPTVHVIPSALISFDWCFPEQSIDTCISCGGATCESPCVY